MSRRGTLVWWTLCLLVTIAVSLPIVRTACGPASMRDVAGGWAVAGLNGLAVCILNRRAVGKSGSRFLRWGLLGNALRLGALLGTLTVYWWMAPARFAAFGLTLVAGALVYMLGEVVALQMDSLRNGAQRR
jgi:hypothetical protein